MAKEPDTTRIIENPSADTRQASFPWGRITLLILLITGLMIAAALTKWAALQQLFPATQSPVETSTTAPDIDALQARIVALEEQTQRLNDKQAQLWQSFQSAAKGEPVVIEQSPSSAAPSEPAISEEKIDALITQKVVDIVARNLPAETANTDASPEQLALVQEDINRLERQLDEAKAQGNEPAFDVRLVIAFQALQGRALSGGAFTETLQQLSSLALDKPALLETTKQLEPYAAEGRPTLAQLKETLKQNIRALQDAQIVKDGTFSSRVKQQMTDMLRIRRIDTEGNSVEAILARAEKAIEDNRVDDAVKEIGALDKESKSHFQPWLKQAQAYLAIPRLLQRIEMQVADYLSGSKAADDAS